MIFSILLITLIVIYGSFEDEDAVAIRFNWYFRVYTKYKHKQIFHCIEIAWWKLLSNLLLSFELQLRKMGAIFSVYHFVFYSPMQTLSIQSTFEILRLEVRSSSNASNHNGKDLKLRDLVEKYEFNQWFRICTCILHWINRYTNGNT